MRGMYGECGGIGMAIDVHGAVVEVRFVGIKPTQLAVRDDAQIDAAVKCNHSACTAARTSACRRAGGVTRGPAFANNCASLSSGLSSVGGGVFMAYTSVNDARISQVWSSDGVLKQLQRVTGAIQLFEHFSKRQPRAL